MLRFWAVISFFFFFLGDGWTSKEVTIELLIRLISDSKPVSKYQDLPKKAGYVPVYIRVGNTPLEQINRDLARAFQEANARSIRGTMIQVIVQIWLFDR